MTDFYIQDQNYHTPVSLGRTQSMTREGFLMVRDVRVGRVGEQIYLPNELMKNGMPLVQPGPDGFVRVQRTADEVFAPMSINSLNTATFTLNHPAEWVGPENRQTLDMGQVMNARRGTGADEGFLLADVLVKDADMIGKIRRKEIRDVSAGYGAEYRDLGGGRAEQYKICHNHLAGLTVDRNGRCGGECSIGDHATVTTDTDKPAFSAESVLNWVMGREKVTAPVVAPAVVAPTTDEGALATLTASVAALAAKVDKLTIPIVKTPIVETTAITADAAALGVKFATVKGSAEILSPGIKLPVAETMTVDHICNCQRLALKGALSNTKTADAVKAFGTANIDTLDGAALEMMFAGAAELVRQQNNSVAARSAATAATSDALDIQAMRVPERLKAEQAFYSDYWAKQAAGQ
jgi:hypothetical protein